MQPVSLAVPLPIIPLLPRRHLVPPPLHDATLWTDNRWKKHVTYKPTPVEVSTGIAAAATAARTSGRKPSKTSILYDMTHVSVSLETNSSFSYKDMQAWHKEEKNMVSMAKGEGIVNTHVWNGLPFHSKWHTMIKDYVHYPTGADYYKNVVLNGAMQHEFVPIFTCDGGPNDLDMLMATVTLMKAKPEVLYSVVAVVAARAWWTINDRFYRYQPRKKYSSVYPSYIVRVHEQQDSSLVYTSEKSKRGSCILNNNDEEGESKHEDCVCCTGDLYEAARTSTTAEFICYVMARICRWYPDYCTPHLDTFDHETLEKTAKQCTLWLYTTCWTRYPLDVLFDMYNDGLKDIGGHEASMVQIGYKNAWRHRSKKGLVLKKPKIAQWCRYADYCLPTFYGHIFGQPNTPTLRPNTHGTNKASWMTCITLDMCNFLGKGESKSIEIPLKRLLERSRSSPAVLLSSETEETKSIKRKRPSPSSASVKNIAVHYRQQVNCVETRYLFTAPTKLLPPVCLLPHQPSIIGADLYDESSPSWLSVEYVLWCMKQGARLFTLSGTTDPNKLKWPLISPAASAPCDDIGIQIYHRIYVVPDATMTIQEKYTLSLSKQRQLLWTPLHMICLFDALNVIAKEYEDVICTLAFELGVTCTDSSIQSFIDVLRKGKEEQERLLHHKLYDDDEEGQEGAKRSRTDDVFGHLLKLGRSALKQLALEWNPSQPFKPSNVPGLGMLTYKQISDALPPLETRPTTNKTDPVYEAIMNLRVCNAGAYLDQRTITEFYNEHKESLLVGVDDDFCPIHEFLVKEYERWYINIWHPLLTAANLLMIRPIIQVYSWEGKIVDYCNSTRKETDLEQIARTTMSDFTDFIAMYPNKLSALCRLSNAKDPAVIHYMRYMISVMGDDPEHAEVAKEAKLSIARASGTVMHGINPNETPIWFSCYHELTKWFERPVCPINEPMLRMYYDRFSNDAQYMAHTAPQTSTVGINITQDAMKGVMTPAQRVAFLLHKISRDNKTAGKVIQTSLIKQGWNSKASSSDPVIEMLKDAILSLSAPLPPPPLETKTLPPPLINRPPARAQLLNIIPAIAVVPNAPIVLATLTSPPPPPPTPNERWFALMNQSS